MPQPATPSPPQAGPKKLFDFKLIEYEVGHVPRFVCCCLMPFGTLTTRGETSTEAINALKATLRQMPYYNATIISVEL